MDQKDQEPKKEKPKAKAFNAKASLGIKFLIIGVLLLLLLIPLGMLKSVLRERQSYRDQVETDVLYSWGGSSTWAGPVLRIPFDDYVDRIRIKDDGSEERYQDLYRSAIYILPKESNITMNLRSEIRTRAIYNIPLYHSEMHFRGVFNDFDLPPIENGRRDYHLDRAEIILSTTDISGLSSISDFHWNSSVSVFQPDSNSELLSQQVVAPIDLSRTLDGFDYSMDLSFQGGRRLQIVPAAQNFQMELQADTSSLGYIGRYLPNWHDQGETTFDALWEINYLSTNIPAQWEEGTSLSLTQSSFGMSMVDRVSLYLKNERAQKYGLLFLVVPFLTFFMFEMLDKKKIHALQYFLAGFSNVVFYLLLLSLSEHWGFNLAYLAAAGAASMLISLYSFAILGSRGKTWIVPLILIGCYSYLFTVLQSEDYALLLGSLGLLLALAVVMFLTRKLHKNIKADSKEKAPILNEPEPEAEK